MTTLYNHINEHYSSINEYATHTSRNYPLVKRWCDKGAIIIDDHVYVPSTKLKDSSAPNMITLKDHIDTRYDSNQSHAATYLGTHRNQLRTWCKRDAVLINGRIWLPKKGGG